MLEFVINVLQIIPASYNNIAKRIKIEGLPDHLRPGSPQDIQMPAPPSAVPTPGYGTPATSGTPQLGTPKQRPSSPSSDSSDRRSGLRNSTDPWLGAPKQPPPQISIMGVQEDGLEKPREVDQPLTIGKKVNVNPSN